MPPNDLLTTEEIEAIAAEFSDSDSLPGDLARQLRTALQREAVIEGWRKGTVMVVKQLEEENHRLRAERKAIDDTDAVNRMYVADLEKEAEALKHDIERAVQRNTDLLADNERLREALTAIDQQAMQVMQDDVSPYGSILRCGWVHETCLKALSDEVRVLNDSVDR